MKIKNNRNSANYINFRDNGISMKIKVLAGDTVSVPAITSVSQILNLGDFNRGFFEIISESTASDAVEVVFEEKKEDSLEKIKKEVKNYTDNE
jgi:hypothetical protein